MPRPRVLVFYVYARARVMQDSAQLNKYRSWFFAYLDRTCGSCQASQDTERHVFIPARLLFTTSDKPSLVSAIPRKAQQRSNSRSRPHRTNAALKEPKTR